MLKFKDGEEFDTSGNLRLELRKDGWYVLGDGCLMALETPEEGVEVITKLNEVGGGELGGL